MNNSGKKVLSGVLALGTGTIINIIVSILTTPIITRLVAPESYGEWSIFTMYTSIALMVLSIGLDQALIRFFYDHENIDYRKSLLKSCFTLSVIVSLAIEFVFFVLVSTRVISFDFSGLVLILLCLNVFINVINRFSMIVLRITYKIKLYSVCTVFTKLIFTGFVLVAVIFTNANHMLVLCLGTLLSFLIPTFIGIFINKEIWSFRQAKYINNIKDVLKYSTPFIVSMGLTTLFQSIDKISLNHYCTYREVGIYASAMTIVHIFAIIQSVFNTMWAPIQVEHFTKNPGDTSFFSKVNSYMTIIMFFFGASILLCKDLVVYLLGSSYREATFILPFLIFNPIMYTLSETTNTGIEISKKSYYHILIGVVACVVNLIGNTALVPHIGTVGAAISTGISYIVYFAMRTIISLKYFKVDYKLIKFTILLVLQICFAGYATKYTFSIIYIVMYVAILVAIAVLYKSDLIEGRRKVVNLIHKKGRE